jgi:phospholipid-transporting ATPase
MEVIPHKSPGEHIDTLAASEREDDPKAFSSPKYADRSSYVEETKLNPSPTKASVLPESKAVRVLRIETNAPLQKHCSNKITTSRYTLLTWAPKSLLQQFRRAANVYFLIISILSFMTFSPKTPASMVGTFAAVLIFTMLKEAFEDYKRHRADAAVNRTPTQRFNESIQAFEDVKTETIKVCDFVKVRENEPLPADLILLASSDEKGVAYLNTMNLDGETNLKEKYAHKHTKRMDLKLILARGMRVECDTPDASLISWNCKVQFQGGGFFPLSMSQLLLRGCVLKNTMFVIGLVVYTGSDTKVMLNSKAPPSKVSNVLKTMNQMLYTIFGLQAAICFLFAGLYIHWSSDNAALHSHYITTIDPEVPAGDYFVQILTFYVAYSHMIPISLYVALEVLKLLLAYLISQDKEMYDEEDDRRASCRTSDLVEELGQVEFVFSDKTGTLTRNVMELRKVSINGVIYGGEKQTPGLAGVSGDPAPSIIMENRPMTDPERSEIQRFFTQLAICHAVFSAEVEPGVRKYQAASPDDLALVQCSADMRFVFLEREDNSIRLQYSQFPIDVWEVLADIPFDSTRKRMSMLVKEPHTSKILLMSKGADSVIFERLRQNEKNSTAETHTNRFASEGLRTLVIAQRYVEELEAINWLQTWNELTLSTSPNKDTLLNLHAELLEKDLELVGITAIEDQLQDKVPETIKLLLDAEIRVWVLTGDKQETAVQIGTTCQLLQEDMQLLDLSSDTKQELGAKLQDFTHEYIPPANTSLKGLNQVRMELATQGTNLGIVINGATLAWVLSPGSEFRTDFFRLGFVSRSCLCCRVSPAQKMQVVKLVKDHGNWVTLAIGDGANDVSMIQEAHIGVGIAGKEGAQAVQSSDFAFSQFRFLQRLLLVHGRWSYRRVSWFICYYFYKNIAVVFTEIWFAFFNGFSGQIYFADWLPQLYNSLWTSWPCILTFVFERDLSHENSLKFPIAYGAGQRRLYFTFKKFWKWVSLGIFHGVLCFWMAAAGLEATSSEDGTDTGLWLTSTLSFTLVIHIVTYKLFLESVFWTKVNM